MVPPTSIPHIPSKRISWSMVSKAAERSRRLNSAAFPIFNPEQVISWGNCHFGTKSWPETRLKWVLIITFLQEHLKLPTNHIHKQLPPQKKYFQWSSSWCIPLGSEKYFSGDEAPPPLSRQKAPSPAVTKRWSPPEPTQVLPTPARSYQLW